MAAFKPGRPNFKKLSFQKKTFKRYLTGLTLLLLYATTHIHAIVDSSAHVDAIVSATPHKDIIVNAIVLVDVIVDATAIGDAIAHVDVNDINKTLMK